MLLFVTACATGPIAEWRDPEFSGPVDSILIIGASDQSTARRLFEDTFVRELRAQEVDARSSYNELTIDQILSREALESAIENQPVDVVLVTRLLSSDEYQIYHPPAYYMHYGSYHRYTRHALQVATPGKWENYKVLKLETNLYDAVTQQLVWSIQTESIRPSTPRQVIEEQIQLAIDSLRKSGLLPTNP
jgi:hypothetical protein